MNYIDIVLIIPLAYAAYKGFKNGLIVEVFTLLALFVGLYAGIHLSEGTSKWVQTNWDFQSEYLPVIAFTLTFLGVGAIVYFGGKMLEKVVDIAQLSLVNKFAGVLLSLLKMIYILSAIIVLMEAYDKRGNFIDNELKETSLMYYPIKAVAVTTIPQIEESSLKITDNVNEDTYNDFQQSVDDIKRVKEIADSLGIDIEDAKEIMNQVNDVQKNN